MVGFVWICVLLCGSWASPDLRFALSAWKLGILWTQEGNGCNGGEAEQSNHKRIESRLLHVVTDASRT